MTDSGRRLRRAAQQLGHHETVRRLGAAVVRGLAGSLALLAALVVFDRFVPLALASSRLPVAVAALGFVIALLLPAAFGFFTWLARRPALKDLEESARRTERQSAALRERLLPALQVLRVRDESRTGYSSDLVDALVDDTVRDVEAVRPDALPYNARWQRAWREALAAAAVAAAVVGALGPGRAARGLVDVATAITRLGPHARPDFAVHPGNVSVPRGAAVRLAADVRHAILSDGAARGFLEWREGEAGSWRQVALLGSRAAADDASRATFTHEVTDVHETFHYRFRHAGAVSSEYQVKAVAAPSLAIESVRYRYPAYTGLAERVVEDGSGELAALRGTVAHVVARSTNDARSGVVRFGDGTERALQIDSEGRVVADIELKKDDTYVMHVEDVLGLVNPNPLEYRVRALPDEAPFIRVLEPGGDRDLDESMKVELRFSALDDYGLGPIQLVWEVGRRAGRAHRDTLFTPSGIRTEAEGQHEWDLAKADLLPGDTVVYHLEVRDNNVLDGPSTSRTRDYVLRFPTLGEVFAQIDEHHEESIQDLSKIVDEAKKVETKVQDLSREMLKRGESSWENRQEMERAADTQQQLADKLSKAREQIESNMQQLSQSELATLEAVQKMEKIRELLDEVATKEMKEALEKLRKALEEANPQRQQENLADFQASQEELMRQLDRVLENLKQFQLDESMKAAVRRMEELAARQERVNDQLANRDGKQKDADSEAKDAAKDDKGKDEKAEDGDSKSKEDSGAKDSKDGDSQKSDKKGQSPKSEKDLERMANEEKSLSKETRDLEKEIQDLAQKTKELREQQDADTMKKLSEKMGESQIPQTMDKMSDHLSGGEPSEAGEQGEKALTQLRELLSQLSDAQQGMSMHMVALSQAAINRAVRDLLALSTDQETLAGDLSGIPGNSSSATRAYADEQQLLLRGGERVRTMLREVAKDTPLMESRVGRDLDAGLSSMHDVADGLETGAVHLARDESSDAVEELNSVVIALLDTQKQMSSCSSSMPMSGFMQQLQDLAQNQEKLNQKLKQLREQGGSSLDHRMQAQLRTLAEQQRALKEQLQQLLEQSGGGQGLLGRLDDVSKKLDEVTKKLAAGNLDDQTLRDQEWALTRLLDSQRSIRERDMGRERKSRTGEELGDLPPPSALPEGTERTERDLREDLLKALERRYPPKYEDLIRRYFRELSREVPDPNVP